MSDQSQSTDSKSKALQVLDRVIAAHSLHQLQQHSTQIQQLSPANLDLPPSGAWRIKAIAAAANALLLLVKAMLAAGPQHVSWGVVQNETEAASCMHGLLELAAHALVVREGRDILATCGLVVRDGVCSAADFGIAGER